MFQIGMQATAMGSQAVVAGAMKTTAKAMGDMNKQIDVVGMQQDMQQFERQSAGRINPIRFLFGAHKCRKHAQPGYVSGEQ